MMMDENKKGKIYDKSNDILGKIQDKIDNGATIEDTVLEFETFAYGTAHESLMNGIIVEKEIVYETLEFFIKINDKNKMKDVAFILNKYYKGFLTEKFEELIINEEYETCSKLKDLI